MNESSERRLLVAARWERAAAWLRVKGNTNRADYWEGRAARERAAVEALPSIGEERT